MSRQGQQHGGIFPANLIVGAALLFLCLWAMLSPAGGLLAAAPSGLAGAATVLVFVGTFGTLAFNVVNRLIAVAIGALACLAVGIILRFYFPTDAASYLYGKLDTLLLLAGVSTVTVLLDTSGFFEVVASWTLRTAGTSEWRVMAGLCTLTFLLSMFVNNLAAILVIIPLSLRIADALELDAVALVLGEVIASNLGGASTMIGDFPNILIATETGLPFHEFLIHLAPICVLQLGILLVFLSPAFDDTPLRHGRASMKGDHVLAAGRWDRDVATRGLVILGLMVVGFLVSGWLAIPPAWIAGTSACLALFFGKVPPGRLARGVCWEDVLFFSCLFVMVGAVDGSGLLDTLGAGLGPLWMRNPLLGAVALAWGAAMVTAILNAGPTTALLAHIIITSTADIAPGEAVWWALSLGVCAGSSATMTGATAGPVSAGILERHGRELSFHRFARTGIPIMLAFLVVSSCYLIVVVSLS